MKFQQFRAIVYLTKEKAKLEKFRQNKVGLKEVFVHYLIYFIKSLVIFYNLENIFHLFLLVIVKHNK